MAEALFRHKAGDGFEIESAGTGNWHVGHDPDRRTIRTLAEHGIHEYSKARQVTSSDFERFDFIIAMDEQNFEDLCAWPGARREKVSLMMSWVEAPPTQNVPDPYHGDMEDFELVYELLDEATTELLNILQRNPDANVKKCDDSGSDGGRVLCDSVESLGILGQVPGADCRDGSI